MEVKRDILWRVYLSYLGIVVLGLVILGRTFFIQHIQGRYWKSLADSLHQRYVEVSAERGTIYDENGSMLSTSIPYFDVYIDFSAQGLREKNGLHFRQSLDSLSGCLARMFGDHTAQEYKRELEKGYAGKDRSFLLKRNLSFEDYEAMRNFPLVRLGRNKSGFVAQIREKRLTPYKLLANRVIGLVREDARVRNVGLEATYDTVLRGVSGKRLVRYIAGGTMVPVEGAEIDAEKGKDIVTTLNVTIQDIAEEALMKELVKNQAQHGTCIVMETATGKIRAMANLGYQESDNAYWEDYNYAISATEPGSTFKLTTLLSLLDDHKVRLSDPVNIEGGVWKVDGRTIHDAERDEKTVVSVREAFEASSNVGMAKLAYTYYENNPYPYLRHIHALHMDSVTGIDLSGEAHPVVKNPKSKTWSATTLPWMAFGYEVLVSPLQTLMMYNAVANNGVMMKPYLVDEIRQYGRTVKQFGPTILRQRICSDETLKLLRECLRGVVADSEGTAKSINSKLYAIAGKTGTALVANGKKGYGDHIYQSSFVGYFPADHPMFTCIVVIVNRPHAQEFFGAKVAGPVFKEVADQLYALYGNAPGVWPAPDTSRLVSATPRPEPSGLMPGLQGLGLEDALSELESRGLKVRIQGKGKVLAQSVPAGEDIARGQTIYLQLGS